METIEVRTADTDVIAILAGAFFELTSKQPSGLPLVQARTSGSIASMTSVAASESQEHDVSCVDWL